MTIIPIMKIMAVKGIMTIIKIMRIMAVTLIFWNQILLLRKIDNTIFKVRLALKLTKKAIRKSILKLM